jgi:hypothetical protein
MAGFYPPPPVFLGGAQPNEGRTLDPFDITALPQGTAFEPAAFQSNAFQIYGGTAGAAAQVPYSTPSQLAAILQSWQIRQQQPLPQTAPEIAPLIADTKPPPYQLPDFIVVYTQAWLGRWRGGKSIATGGGPPPDNPPVYVYPRTAIEWQTWAVKQPLPQVAPKIVQTPPLVDGGGWNAHDPVLISIRQQWVIDMRPLPQRSPLKVQPEIPANPPWRGPFGLQNMERILEAWLPDPWRTQYTGKQQQTGPDVVPPVVIPPMPDVGGRAKPYRPRKHRWYVEIDGEEFEVASEAEALHLLKQARETAKEAARLAAEASIDRTAAEPKQSAPVLPQISVAPGLESILAQPLQDVRDAIEEIYRIAFYRAAHNEMLRREAVRAQIAQDEHDAVQALLQHEEQLWQQALKSVSEVLLTELRRGTKR